MSESPKLQHCEREQQVLDALLSGRWAGPWGEEIREHAAACAACSEVVLVAQALQRESTVAAEEAGEPGAGPPPAGLVWWKAQRAALRAAEEQAAQPITLVARVAQAFGVLALAGTALWQWPRISAWLGSAHGVERLHPAASTGTEWIERLSQAFASPATGFLLAASAGALLTLMAFAAYVVWREE
ncbi:MAG TPA: hypothetical protein VL523_04205 [Terriglobia bacterium]|nr:hypothetical protein [Terriglobia bacterium]